MKGQINLNNPIKINNKDIKTLSYDTNEITTQLFAEADSKKMRASGSKGGNLSGAVELDYGLHLYLGYAAVIAVNDSYTFEDLERCKGTDLMQVMRVGRNFILPSGERQSENSDEQSETTPDATTPRSATSKKSE